MVADGVGDGRESGTLLSVEQSPELPLKNRKAARQFCLFPISHLLTSIS